MLEKWNPAVKAAAILTAVFMLSFCHLVSLNLLVFALSLFFLFFFSKAKKKRILALLLPACLAAFGLFVTGLYYARGNAIDVNTIKSLSSSPDILQSVLSRNLYTGLQLSTRLLAFAGLGLLFALTTESTFFMASLHHQLRLPAKFSYGILASFHLMPGMVREYKKVRLAYQIRGLKTKPWSVGPLFTMLVNAVHWSESIAMAMESKGFDGNGERTCYLTPKIKTGDVAGAVFMIGSIGLGMHFLSL